MLNETQLALYDRLSTLEPLMEWLANGENSMFPEGDAPPDVPAPFLIFQSGGSRIVNHFRIENWTIRLYTRQEGYHDLEIMLAEVENHLTNIWLPVSEFSYWTVLNDGVRFLGSTTRNFDQLFKAENEGLMYEIHLIKK